MCRIPKVVLIAPQDEHLTLRRALGSLEYDIVAALAPGADVDLTADVALVRDPGKDLVRTLHDRGLKVASFGAGLVPPDVDLDLGDDVASFKTRIWDALRASPQSLPASP